MIRLLRKPSIFSSGKAHDAVRGGVYINANEHRTSHVTQAEGKRRRFSNKFIAIISGCGANIASVKFAFEKIHPNVVLTQDTQLIRQATHVILPGVGTAHHAMQTLKDMQLIDTILSLKQPVLGICIGMQLLFSYSTEGDVECLNIVPDKVKHLNQYTSNRLILPHMGWNQLQLLQESPLLTNIQPNSYFYFVHSYAAPVNMTHCLASCEYGVNFAAVIQKDNFFGVQFHPERSGKNGQLLLKNFLTL